MFKNLSKSILLVGILLISALTLTGCIKKTSDDTELTSCYQQCEDWGGEVDMCKENCDASNDEDSVWNDEDDMEDDQDYTYSSWPGKIPSVIPELEDGTFVGASYGLGTWVVDFKDITETDVDEYMEELETEGWNMTFLAASGTMIMSIYEQTKEIGIIKAIGASNWQVLLIFLIQSAMIGLLGGLLGLGITYTLMKIVDPIIVDLLIEQGFDTDVFFHFRLDYSLYITCGSIVIGILAGIYPAYKASKLNPVNALRYE